MSAFCSFLHLGVMFDKVTVLYLFRVVTHSVFILYLNFNVFPLSNLHLATLLKYVLVLSQSNASSIT